MTFKRIYNLKFLGLAGALILGVLLVYLYFLAPSKNSVISELDKIAKVPGNKSLERLEVSPLESARENETQVFKPVPKTDTSERTLLDVAKERDAAPAPESGQKVLNKHDLGALQTKGNYQDFTAIPKSQGSGSIEGSKEIGWNDLVPKSLTVEKMEELMAKSAVYKGIDSVFFDPKYFPAVKNLNGKKVTIPGFMVSMDFDAKSIKEFLLVPYMGACVHSPPPPPNQIIFVKMKEGVKPLPLNEPFTMTGKLFIQTQKSELANALYVMEGLKISEYNEE